MKCLRLIGRQESCQFSIKNHLFSCFVFESLYFYLLCLSAALLCYTGFQNYSLIRSTSCSCSTCCFCLGIQLQNVQDFIKISRALIKDIFLVPPQSGSPTWGKGAVAASNNLQRVLPREVTHVRPKSDLPLLRADDNWGRVPSHILINLQAPPPGLVFNRREAT